MTPDVKILLVEDDVETAIYVETGLSKSGHTVERAADGREAVAMATRGGFDVMIVDRMRNDLSRVLTETA